MKTTQLDRIITSAPLNATAGRVVSKGTHYEPKIALAPGYDRRETPPPLRRMPPDMARVCGHLVGAKIGRLTVLGPSAEHKGRGGGKGQARWVVRCSCGAYEFRKTRTLRTGDPSAPCMMCVECADLVRKRQVYDSEGSRDLSEFIRDRDRGAQRRDAPAARPEGQEPGPERSEGIAP